MYLPGSRFSTSIISRTLDAGKAGFAIRKKLTVPTGETGAKSFTGFTGEGLYSAGLMPRVVLVAMSSVYPSGGDFATNSAPTSVPAPGLLSITTGCFRFAARRSPIARARRSVRAPAGYGTTILIGRLG